MLDLSLSHHTAAAAAASAAPPPPSEEDIKAAEDGVQQWAGYVRALKEQGKGNKVRGGGAGSANCCCSRVACSTVQAPSCVLQATGTAAAARCPSWLLV